MRLSAYELARVIHEKIGLYEEDSIRAALVDNPIDLVKLSDEILDWIERKDKEITNEADSGMARTRAAGES